MHHVHGCSGQKVEAGLCEAGVVHWRENRYSNLFPYDATRLILAGQAGQGDYLNASWVGVAGGGAEVVLAAAPLHPTRQQALMSACQRLIRHTGRRSTP